MSGPTHIQRVDAIVARYYGNDGRTFAQYLRHPFDYSKPNLHDTKAEFLAEVDLVNSLEAHVLGLFEALRPMINTDKSDDPVARMLGAYLDFQASERGKNRDLKYVSDVPIKNMLEISLHRTTLLLLIEWNQVIKARKQELETQRLEYWSSSGRAPNHYARIIALRFAKYVARVTGARPTFGVSSDGDHPSTDFGRALEEIFVVLGIKTKFRRPAEWAIAQLTEDDMRPVQKDWLMGGLLATSDDSDLGYNALASLMVESPPKGR